MVRAGPVPAWAAGFAVLLVTHCTRGGERGHVVLEGTAQGLFGAQPGEGQVQHRLTHLSPQAPPLVGPAEPRPGLDRTKGGKLLGAQLLDTHRTALDEDRSGESPLVGIPVRPLSPPELGGLPGARAGLDVGPRLLERHGCRVVDPLVDDIDEGGELVLPGKAQLQARRADGQAEQGPEGLLPHGGQPPGW